MSPPQNLPCLEDDGDEDTVVERKEMDSSAQVDSEMETADAEIVNGLCRSSSRSIPCQPENHVVCES